MNSLNLINCYRIAVIYQIFSLFGCIAISEILPDKKIRGMNATLMCEYVEYVADNLMRALGYVNIYNSKLPPLFNFMQMISLEGKTNFFERRVSEYSLAGVGEENNSFNLNSSF